MNNTTTTQKFPVVGHVVRLTEGYYAGLHAKVTERRHNGLYRVVLQDGADKGVEIYGLTRWQMEIAHD